MLISSTGGHFRTLANLEGFWKNQERCWVTLKNKATESALDGERVHWAIGPTNRNIGNCLKNLILAAKVVAQEKPEMVVSTGAGIAVPFIIMAKLSGSKVVFIESITRVEEISLSAKLILPLLDGLYVRWQQLQTKYPFAQVIPV